MGNCVCIQTIWLRKQQQEVPCGRCYECVKRRRNDWYVRCIIEKQTRRHSYFGLLTYAEVGKKLEKRDIQLFLKRLRSYGNKFSYLIAGEHGEKKDRPHWHCIFFSDEPLEYQKIAQAWRGGYENSQQNTAGWIKFSIIQSNRAIRYTVKYIYKYDGVDPRFVLLISKNPAIGHSFLKHQVYFLTKKTTDFTVEGQKTAMPRYYKRKIFDGYEDIKEEINSGLAAKVAELTEREIDMAQSLYPNNSREEIKYLIKKSKIEANYEFQRRKN